MVLAKKIWHIIPWSFWHNANLIWLFFHFCSLLQFSRSVQFSFSWLINFIHVCPQPNLMLGKDLNFTSGEAQASSYFLKRKSHFKALFIHMANVQAIRKFISCRVSKNEDFFQKKWFVFVSFRSVFSFPSHPFPLSALCTVYRPLSDPRCLLSHYTVPGLNLGIFSTWLHFFSSFLLFLHSQKFCHGLEFLKDRWICIFCDALLM